MSAPNTPALLDQATAHSLEKISGYLLLAYTLLVVYLSLYPFTGWRLPIDTVFFLQAPWPRYITAFDLSVNLLAYVPIGFLAYAQARTKLTPPSAVVLAFVTGLSLSLALESLQMFLPSRIASTVDLLANSAGAAVGALLYPMIDRSPFIAVLKKAWQATFLSGIAQAGPWLLALWLVTQLNPAIPFFGAGNMNNSLIAAWNAQHGELLFRLPQAVGTALNVCGFGLFVSVLTRPQVPPLRFVLGIIGLGLLLKTIAAGALLKPQLIFDWLGTETMLGVVAGVLAFALLARAGYRARVFVAAMVILAGGLMSKIAAIYDGLDQVLRVFNWPHGQLLNFASLTQFLHEAWPLLALIYLIANLGKLARKDAGYF